ncbi:unnamed protein product [Periconia digitata]|uniref:Uncharacterized protein n=1 Tax=Periconia digitata TaxID=1303443 RepID=A0A9W4ULM5_9PLEO|nr:unnamed protein product [Periconia digitata]
MSNNTVNPPPTSAAPAPSSSQPAPQSSDPPSQQPSLTSPPSSADPPTSSPPPPASTPASLPPSSNSPSPPPASSQPPPSSNNAPSPSSSDNPPASTVTAPTTTPSTTDIITSIVTNSPTAPGETPQVSTKIITRTAPGQAGNTQGTNGGGAAAKPSSSSDSAAPGLQNLEGKDAEGGLSTGGKTAIAVVVPVVVVALLVLGGILLWRRRKSKKNAEEARRKEVEEYGFNPNDDPTLPAVGMQSEMAEDQSGYRGWGNTTTSSNRKASTTLTSGMTYSDSNSNPGGYHSPGSPTNAAFNDAHSGEPLMDGVGVLGAGPNANHNQQNQNGVHRGTSNASSSYSAAERSDNSGDYPLPNHPQELYNDNNQGYYHASPYDPNGYGAAPPQPIIRDVSARRNTRIESPSVFPQQGNSGIAQNF